MGNEHMVNLETGTVTLYTSQRDVVVSLIEENDVYMAKMKFIKEKYEEVAPVFLAAYQWYIVQAGKLVPKPMEAESAIWAFSDLQNVSAFPDSKILTLQVPMAEVILFDMMDWTDILNFRYLGEEKSRSSFQQKTIDHGVKDPTQIILTPFYPQLKQELQASWQRLFRHHQRLFQGQSKEINHVQAGLWQIKREWVIQTK